MTLADPICHPELHKGDGRKVCSACFEDEDIKALIEGYEGAPGCDFCGESDAPTAPFDDVAEHITARINEFYGKAAEQLPYESAEGGYQGWHCDTYDLLRDSVGLELPRDDGDLFSAIVSEVGDDTWCEYDWLSLEPDESLEYSWNAFCEVVKHSRRFFFHDVGERERFQRDERSPAQFFDDLGKLVDAQDLIVEVAAPYPLFRARVRHSDIAYSSAADLGPPPPELATQSNRMNPPGISMFYGADNATLATAETRGQSVSVGRFETLRAIRLLDLANLPDVPGFFSDAYRMQVYALSFLRGFAERIIEPVPRNDRTQIDYIPTQVFTEFLRDYAFDGGAIDGIRYRSATGEPGTNVVLFATPLNVVDSEPDGEYAPKSDRWLRLVDVVQLDLADNT